MKATTMAHQELEIRHNMTLKEVQHEFQSRFPGLNLQFFHHPHEEGAPSERRDLIDTGKKVKDVQRFGVEGSMDMGPEMTVTEFENGMRDKFGLNVQVIRRSGRTWIQTTMTDHWTLEHQNGIAHDTLENPDNS